MLTYKQCFIREGFNFNRKGSSYCAAYIGSYRWHYSAFTRTNDKEVFTRFSM